MRKANNGEQLKALDGNIYKLDDTMTVIADAKGVQAIGGIIGGEQSGCSEYTKNIFVESQLILILYQLLRQVEN